MASGSLLLLLLLLPPPLPLQKERASLCLMGEKGDGRERNS
jgi:hypothetical protein